jgi:PAS domain S-box-containing protein
LAAEQQFSRTFRTSPLPSCITSFDGRYLDVSDTFCQLTGYSREDVIGKSSVDLEIWADPADRDRMIQMFKEQGACSGLEVSFRLKNSSIAVVDLSASIIYLDDRPVIYSVTRDLTAQRHAEEERRRMEMHVARVQRLESLGVLAGGIAHDFNNMLAVIAGNSALASRQLTASGPEMALRCLEEIERAAMQARHLTQQLLTFARGGAPQRAIFALGSLLREAVGFALAGSQHRCVFEVPDDLSAVDADSGQIGQVLHNLVLNAAQAMHEPGTIQVRAENVTEPGQQVERWVKVSVVDSGPGVPTEIAPNIFDPFFTTKERGNGLGLATAHSIVVAHGGRLELMPSGRPGSTFSFWIPAAGTDARVEPSTARSQTLERKLHILLLDDQPSLIRVMKSGLEAEGHRVRGAKDSSEAVEYYRAALESGDRFDVVVMDLTIPGSMGGAAALEQIKELDPTVTAIAASGYSNDPVMSDYAAYGFAGRLPKPFRQAELTSAIAAALERRR